MSVTLDAFPRSMPSVAERRKAAMARELASIAVGRAREDEGHRCVVCRKPGADLRPCRDGMWRHRHVFCEVA